MKQVNDEIPIEETFEPFLKDKSKGKDGTGGNYRRNVERELDNFKQWAEGSERSYSGVVPDDEDRKPLMKDLTDSEFRKYARHLRSERGLKANTAQTYYQYISSWCGWCEGEEYIQSHFADRARAKEPLPESDRKPGDQQAWSQTQRNQITQYINKKGYETVDEYRSHDLDSSERKAIRYPAIRDARDRAFVNIIAYTAVRIGELLRDPNDPRRKGLIWDDVNLDEGTILVYRKKQDWDSIALSPAVSQSLERYYNVIEPPSGQWPVFPTFHQPTLSSLVNEELKRRGNSESEINQAQDSYSHDLLLALEENIIPKSTSTDGGRNILKKLSEEAGVEIDDPKHTYLAPHGGRRGLGEVLVQAKGYTVAARYLDNSEEMVRKRYSHIEPGEMGDIITEAIEDDKTERTPSTKTD
jgi:integrase